MQQLGLFMVHDPRCRWIKNSIQSRLLEIIQSCTGSSLHAFSVDVQAWSWTETQVNASPTAASHIQKRIVNGWPKIMAVSGEMANACVPTTALTPRAAIAAGHQTVTPSPWSPAQAAPAQRCHPPPWQLPTGAPVSAIEGSRTQKRIVNG